MLLILSVFSLLYSFFPPLAIFKTEDSHKILVLMEVFHYYRLGHLSRFQRAICPGFGTGIWLPGQKPSINTKILSRVVEPGQNVPHAKIFLRPAGFEPKTYYLAHGFLASSPK